jgi:hypothetical protein
MAISMNIDRLQFAILDDALATYFGMIVRDEHSTHDGPSALDIYNLQIKIRQSASRQDPVLQPFCFPATPQLLQGAGAQAPGTVAAAAALTLVASIKAVNK